jgi:hypothetical protein
MAYILSIRLFKLVDIKKDDTDKKISRYQRGNQNSYIEEEQTTQWPKEKVQKDQQRSTKHTYKTKDRVTGTPLKTGGELRCSRRVSSSCSTSGTRRVKLVSFLYFRFSTINRDTTNVGNVLYTKSIESKMYLYFISLFHFIFYACPIPMLSVM